MAAADGQQPRWSAHPWRARGLRLLVYALPIAGSLVFVRLATEVVAVPTKSIWVFLAWWLAMSLSATGVVSLIYAVSRRLLPLGALLDLSLVFPDESPSRFKLAMRRAPSRASRSGCVSCARRTSRRCAGGRRDSPPAGWGARRPRQDHARALRTRPRLFLQPRQAAKPGSRGARPSQLGRAPARRRQAQCQHGDPEQARQAD